VPTSRALAHALTVRRRPCCVMPAASLNSSPAAPGTNNLESLYTLNYWADVFVFD
jgi:hypothetical protein